MKIGIVGDYVPNHVTHKATDEALVHSAARLGIRLETVWIPTGVWSERPESFPGGCQGLWIAPGFPDSPDGVLQAIRMAREQLVPLLATCGGFQSLILEYARHVLGLEEAEHEERSPDAPRLLIRKLSCSLAGQIGEVRVESPSLVSGFYPGPVAYEPFRCSYGLNPDYEARIQEAGLRITGKDPAGEPRIVELPEHPFFIGTLYVPQLNSTPDAPHPLIDAFVRAALPAAPRRE